MSRADAEALHEEAARRVLQSHAAGVRPEDDLTLAAWRREDPAHEAAFARVARTWDDARLLRDAPGYDALLGAPTWRERLIAGMCRFAGSAASARWPRRAAFASLLLAVTASTAYLLWPERPDYRTRVAETRDVRLDDGSTVTLGARSALDVRYTAAERRVRLAGGEAFFSVAGDTARPFVVVAGDTVVRVVGTRFNVNYADSRARVSVLEGVVDVSHAVDVSDASTAEQAAPDTSKARPVRLHAGEQLLVRDSAPLPPPEPLRGAEPGAWREGRLSYRDALLAEVVADANRYRSRAIRIASPALAEQRITTSFRTTQIDDMLDTLPDTLPLVVQRRPDGSVELHSRQ